MSVPLKPLADRVVAVREQKESKTASGLYLPDGAKENWWQTIRRVIEGVYTMQKKWILLNNLGWDNRKAQNSAQEMYERMFSMKFLPSGRGLWAWGSPITEERGLYMALNSCAMVSTENIKENPA